MDDTTDIAFDFGKIEKLLNSARTKKALIKSIVDLPFMDKYAATCIDLGTVVLLVKNDASDTIDRIAISDTESALQAQIVSKVPFKEIKIPAGHPQNIISQALITNEPQATSDWSVMFTPVLSASEANINQRAAGIDCSYVYPFFYATGSGALIFSYYQPISHTPRDRKRFMSHYAALVSKVMPRLDGLPKTP